MPTALMAYAQIKKKMIAHDIYANSTHAEMSSCIVGNEWLYFHVGTYYYIVYAHGRRQ